MRHAIMPWKGAHIFVTVESPQIRDSATGKLGPPKGYLAAFKFDPLGTMDGEYLRNTDGSPRWFKTEDDAQMAAFEEAVRRMEQRGP